MSHAPAVIPRLPPLASNLLFKNRSYLDAKQGTRAAWDAARSCLQVRYSGTGKVVPFPGIHRFMRRKIFKRPKALPVGAVVREGEGGDNMARGVRIMEELCGWVRNGTDITLLSPSAAAILTTLAANNLMLLAAEVPIAALGYHFATPMDLVAIDTTKGLLCIIEVKAAAGGYIDEPVERWRSTVKDIMEAHGVPPTAFVRFHVQNLLQIDALVDDHDLPREKLDPRVCRVDGVAELSEPPRQLLDAWPEVRAALRASVVHRAAPKTRRPKLAICPLGCGARYAYASGVMKHLAKVHTLHLPVSVQDAMAASLGQTTAKRVRRVAAIRGLLPPLKRKRSRRVA